MSRTFRKIVIKWEHGRFGWSSRDDLKLKDNRFKTVDNYYMQDGKLSTGKKLGYTKENSSSRERMLFNNELPNILLCDDYEDYSYPDNRAKLLNVCYEYF